MIEIEPLHVSHKWCESAAGYHLNMSIGFLGKRMDVRNSMSQKQNDVVVHRTTQQYLRNCVW